MLRRYQENCELKTIAGKERNLTTAVVLMSLLPQVLRGKWRWFSSSTLRLGILSTKTMEVLGFSFSTIQNLHNKCNTDEYQCCSHLAIGQFETDTSNQVAAFPHALRVNNISEDLVIFEKTWEFQFVSWPAELWGLSAVPFPRQIGFPSSSNSAH